VRARVSAGVLCVQVTTEIIDFIVVAVVQQREQQIPCLPVFP
jgi:hypothetical protein